MENAVRVALVARPAQGGIRSHLILLHRHLSEDYLPRILAPASLLDTLPQTQTKSSVPLEITAHIRPSDIRIAKHLSQLIKPYEIVHAHGIRAGWICALAHAWRRFPLVVTFHNVPPKTFLGKLAVAVVSRQADRCIAVSGAIASVLPGRKTRLIPNGIEIDRFILGDRAKAHESLGVETDAFLIGCVARLSREKGVDVLLGAAKENLDLQFVVVGDGPERSALERRASPNVRFLGYREDIATCMNAFDLVVIPSRSEGQGMVALEAFASGCPVIATRVGGLAETVQGGETGLLIAPNDSSALSHAIKRLMQDALLQNTLRSNAFAYVTQFGTVDRMCRATASVYRDTLGIDG